MYDKHTNMYVNNTLFTVPEQKILEVFLDLKKHYFAEISKKTKLSRPRTLRVLRKLVNADILKINQEANIKYYSLNKSPPVYVVLSMVEYNKTANFLEKNKTLRRALKMLKDRYKNFSISNLLNSKFLTSLSRSLTF